MWSSIVKKEKRERELRACQRRQEGSEQEGMSPTECDVRLRTSLTTKFCLF